MRRRRAVIVALMLAIVGFAVYATVVDLDGDLAPSADPEEVVDRVGTRVKGAATTTKRTATKVNRELNPTPKRTIQRQYKKAMNDVK